MTTPPTQQEQGAETFKESVERIQKDHNITEREAVRVALSMERLASRRATTEES